MVAMDVAAEKATELPRLGRARMKLSVHASHTEKEVTRQLLDCDREGRGGTDGRTDGRTCTDRGVPTSVDFVEEARAGDRAVAAEGIHHARIGRHREGPARKKKKKTWKRFHRI